MGVAVPIIGLGLSAVGAVAGISAAMRRPKISGALAAPARTDEAGKLQREAELRRKGRASTILTGGSGVSDSTPLSRPQALGA